jgi:hypothetical protein
MKPATAEYLLKWLLRLDGLLMMLAVAAVVMPSTLMDWTHQRLGMGALPADRVTEYLARSCAMLYALHGVVVFAMALDPRRYWRLVRLVLSLHAALGLTVLAIDLKSGMPWYWTVAEGPPVALLAFTMLWLWYRSAVPADG